MKALGINFSQTSQKNANSYVFYGEFLFRKLDFFLVCWLVCCFGFFLLHFIFASLVVRQNPELLLTCSLRVIK